MKQILHRYTGAVLFTSPNATTTAEAVREAITAGANLSDANLSDADLSRAILRNADLSRAILSRADLSHANLSDANLSDANLSDANLSRADLSHANLSHADLSRANLSHANLSHANLSDANLSGADLSDANLSGADLSGTDLSDADLSDANTEAIREDFYSILKITPNETPGLLVSLRLGKVDGSTYNGECACLVGTLGNVRGCAYDAIPGLLPNGSRLAERWFLGIRTGDTPATNAVARLTEGWIVDWVKEHAPKAAETIAADDAFASALASIQAKRLEAASANDVVALVTLLPL